MARYAVNLPSGTTDEKGIFRFLGKLFNQSGVVESTALAVSAQATPDMTVKVSGSATNDNAVFINSTDGSFYGGWNDANYNVTIGTNSSGGTRYDAIVAYIDTAAGSASVNNPDGLKIIAVRSTNTSPATSGDIAASAVGTKPYIRLADVTVGNGVSSVNSGNIADTRPRAAVKPSGVVQSATLSKALNDAAVTGLTFTPVVGGSGNGTFKVNGVINISSLAIPATAVVLNWSFWINSVGNTTNQGVVPVALTGTFSQTGANAFYCQIAGNDGGTFPNLTNSKIEGYIRYIP
jgi:hypothetical protein